MKTSLILLISILPAILLGQSWETKSLAISIFNNATMMPPASLTAIFNQPVHPGLTVAYEFGWKDVTKHKWFQNAGISYMYHRFVYQAFILNTQAGYRLKVHRFSLEGYLQAGYMQAFYLTDRSILQSDGSYTTKKGFGKPQFLTGAGMGLGYNLGDDRSLRRIFLTYDVRLQMPFVQSYSPLLPNGTLSIGFQFNLKE